MFTAKARKTIFASFLVLTEVVFAAPARGASASSDLEPRRAGLAHTKSCLDRQIDDLSSRARGANRGTGIRRRVIRSDWRVISLTRGLNDLNRQALGLAMRTTRRTAPFLVSTPECYTFTATPGD